MTSFIKKKILPSKRVCLRLKEARESAGVSLESVSRKTKIDKKYLQALEECRFEDLPSAVVYKKNFIKKYLRAIHIDPKPFIAQFLMEEKIGSEQEHPVQTISSTKFHNIPSFIKNLAVGIILILFLVYLGLQIKKILEPPVLLIYSPRDGLVTNEAKMQIKGKTNPEVYITINGAEVMSNEHGEFEQYIDLSPGINQLTVTAKKRHGKQVSQTRYVILKQENQFISSQVANTIVAIL